MPRTASDIHPMHDRLMGRADKEALLGQSGVCIWLTGLSGSGKSTIAAALERMLHGRRLLTVVLDGDNVRTGINSGLGFNAEERTENIRRVAEVAKLFVQNGIVTVCSFVSPTHALRDLARNIIGAEDLIEVFVDAPLEECERRDVKGLYARARQGGVKDFTGVSAPYEAPAHPDLILKTVEMNVEEAAARVFQFVLPRTGRD